MAGRTPSSSVDGGPCYLLTQQLPVAMLVVLGGRQGHPCTSLVLPISVTRSLGSRSVIVNSTPISNMIILCHSTHAVTHYADTSSGEAAMDDILRVDVMLPMYHDSVSDSDEWGCPAVLDALPASVDCSHLHPLHFVEALHWSRLVSSVARRVLYEATLLRSSLTHTHVRRSRSVYGPDLSLSVLEQTASAVEDAWPA